MQTKHTPGPWKPMYSEDLNIHWVQAKMGSFGLNVANMNGGKMGDTISFDEAKANANLIAAAPELLEALISLHKANRNGKAQRDNWNNAFKAIKKATE